MNISKDSNNFKSVFQKNLKRLVFAFVLYLSPIVIAKNLCKFLGKVITKRFFNQELTFNSNMADSLLLFLLIYKCKDIATPCLNFLYVHGEDG